MAKKANTRKAAEETLRRKKKKKGDGAKDGSALSKRERKNLKKTEERETIYSDVAERIGTKDTEGGIDIGKILAPDITDDEFLDRIQRQRQDEVQGLYDDLGSTKSLVNTDSEELKYYMDRLKQKAETGLTPQEREALAFEGTQGLQSQLSTGLREAQAFSSARGLTGGIGAASFNPAVRNFIQARRGLENDILLAEVAERGRALSEFGGASERRDDRRITGNLAVNQAGQNLTSADQKYQQGIDEFNAQQTAKEIAARINRNAAGLGIIQDTKGDVREDTLFREGLKSATDSLTKLLSVA